MQQSHRKDRKMVFKRLSTLFDRLYSACHTRCPLTVVARPSINIAPADSLVEVHFHERCLGRRGYGTAKRVMPGLARRSIEKKRQRAVLRDIVSATHTWQAQRG